MKDENSKNNEEKENNGKEKEKGYPLHAYLQVVERLI